MIWTPFVELRLLSDRNQIRFHHASLFYDIEILTDTELGKPIIIILFGFILLILFLHLVLYSWLFLLLHILSYNLCSRDL